MEAIRAFIGRVVTVVLLANMVSAVSVGDLEKAKNTVIFWAIITVVANVLAAIGELVGIWSENYVYGNLMLSYYEKLTNKDMQFYRNTHTGYLTAMLRQYVDSGILLSRLIREDLLRLAISLFFPVIVLLNVYWPVGVVALMLLITQTMYIFWASAKANHWRQIAHEVYRKISGVVADDVTNVVAYKSAGREKQALRKMSELRKEENIAFWQRRKKTTLLDFPRNLTVTILAALAFWLALGDGNNSEQTVTVLVMTITYFFQILRNVSDIPQVTYRYDDLITKMEPTLEILSDSYESIQDNPDAQEFHPKEGQVEIRDLSFNYTDGDTETSVFTHLNLEIKGGEKIGIVGVSGAGKSTLASLLMRFDDIQSGEILIDGVNIQDVAQSQLRSHIAYVPQEPLLFHRTIRDNIAYHNNEASDEDIERAAKAAHADEFIQNLPNRYETMVGERGVKLSGGQKQRVVIARAVLKRAPIIIFDEATSALDSESEEIIQKALPEIVGNHTAIIIAHRLSTVAKLDRIIVMDKGRISEEGTHKQLLAKKGKYYSLWQRQIS